MKTRFLLICSLLICAFGMAQNNFDTPQAAPFGLSNLSFNLPLEPNFVDLDGDGDLDILSGAFNGSFYFVENTGTVTSPNFTAATLNPFGLVDTASNSTPSLGDIDNDGDMDLITGNFNNNFLIYFRNDGTNTNPAYSGASVNPWGLSGADTLSSPAWVDLDNDGDLDLMVGGFNGSFKYYQNTGTATTPAYGTLINNPFGLVDVGDSSTPDFVDFDNDGDLDMFTGRTNNDIVYFENTGTVSTPIFAAGVVNAFNYTPVASNPTLTLADLDNDTDIDIIQHVGNNNNFTYYENTLVSSVCNVNIPDANLKSALVGNAAINTNGNSEIECTEASAYTGVLALNNLSIQDMTGVEAFINMSSLNLSNNQIVTFSLTGTYPNLESVYAFHNTFPFSVMTSATIGNAPNLEIVELFSNILTSFSQPTTNTAIERLRLDFNNLTTLDVSFMSDLDFLVVNNNSISMLDITNNPLLTHAQVGGNGINTLDISNNNLLEVLSVEFNNLTTLDVSQKTDLIFLDIAGNTGLSAINTFNNLQLGFLNFYNTGITAIDLTNNNILTELYIGASITSQIDFTNNTLIERLGYLGGSLVIPFSNFQNLEAIEFSNNTQASIDLSQNPQLEELLIYDNTTLTELNLANGNNQNISSSDIEISNVPNLTCISVSDVAYANANFVAVDSQISFSTNCAPVCTVNIPDANFKAALVANAQINTNGNTEIECAEAIAYSGQINVVNQGITDATGIEAFINLTGLNLDNNNLVSIDLSALSNLITVSLRDNANLTTLTLANHPDLTLLQLFECNLTALDVTGCPSLASLSPRGSQLTSIDLSQNPNLSGLNIDNNPGLTSLDVSANTSLSFLSLSSTAVTSLDVTGLSALSYLQITNTNIATIDVSQNSQLITLFAVNTDNITELDLSNNGMLTQLSIGGSAIISSLDLRNGNNSNFDNNFLSWGNTPQLTCINVDNVAYADANWANKDDAGDVYSLDCAAPTNQAPTAQCNAALTIPLDATGNASIIAAQVDGGSSDNDGTITLSVDQSTFTCADLGTNTVTLTVTDDDGATDTCTATVTIVDAIDPIPNTPGNITVSNDPGMCGATQTFLLGATDNCGISSVTANEPAGGFYPVGTTTVTVTAEDTSGNTASSSFTVTVNDTEAPTIDNPGNFTVNTNPGVCTHTVVSIPTIVFSDNCSATLTSDAPVDNIFPLGTTTVTLTATDPSGNFATEAFTVTVIDIELPVLTVPSNFIVDNDPGQCGAVVNFTTTATDNCTVTVTTDAPAGNFFPNTSTLVTVIATDASGNSVTDTFTVTVNDTEAPTIICPADETVLVNIGEQYTLPDYLAEGNATANDNCTFTTTQTPAAGTMLSTGTYTIAFVVEDASGATTTCDFELIVDETLGLNDTTLASFTLFPNPATTQITVAGNFKIETINVYNLIGQKVLTSTSEILNIEVLPSALYLVKIEDTEGNTATKRFIKK